MDTSYKTQRRIDFCFCAFGAEMEGMRGDAACPRQQLVLRFPSKAFHHFRRAWKTDAYQLIAYGVIANLRESE